MNWTWTAEPLTFPDPLPEQFLPPFHLTLPLSSFLFFSLWDSGQQRVFTGSLWLWYWVTVVIPVFKSLILTEQPAFSSGAAQISEPNSGMLEKGEVFLRLPLRLLLTWGNTWAITQYNSRGKCELSRRSGLHQVLCSKMRALCASQKRHRNRRTVCAQLASQHIIRYQR